MNSEDLRKTVVVNDPMEREQDCKIYAYFTDDSSGKGRKPFKGHPYIFTKKDVEFVDELIESGLLPENFIVQLIKRLWNILIKK